MLQHHTQVREVRGRLLRHWQRQVLVEAAAEVFPPSSSSRGPPHVKALLPQQVRHVRLPSCACIASQCIQCRHVLRGPACLPWLRMTLPAPRGAQGEVEVLVPLGWPSGPEERLRVVHLACPELPPGAAAEMMQQVNSDAPLLAAADLLTLLRHVAAALEARLLDAASAAMG